MRKIVFTSPGPYCNTRASEVVEFEDDVSEDEINDYCFEWGIGQYEMYGVEYVPDGEYDDGSEPAGEYTTEIDACWAECDGDL